MFRSSAVSKDYIINPKLLHLKEDEVITDDILQILEKNKITIRMHYSDTAPGDATKPIVVFIHGNSTSKNIFNEQIRHFCGKYRVIALDLLGHGKSTKLSELENISLDEMNSLCMAFYNPLAMMAEVSCLLGSIGVRGAHIIGWSLGGHIAYGVAVSNPELVSSITTIGAPPIRFSKDGFRKGFSEWFVNVLVPEWINQPKVYSVDEAKNIGLHIGFTEKDIEVFVKGMTISDPQMRRNLFLLLETYDAEKYEGSSLDAARFVQNTTIPLCLIVGESDAGIDISSILKVEKDMRHSMSGVHVIKNAPHIVFNKPAVEYYKIVDEFIVAASQVNTLKHSPN